MIYLLHNYSALVYILLNNPTVIVWILYSIWSLSVQFFIKSSAIKTLKSNVEGEVGILLPELNSTGMKIPIYQGLNITL